jgi:choline kinase
MSQAIAVILAAGRGVRMGGRTPKTLIPMGEHEPLLHYILRGLAAAEIAEVTIVTGFKPEEIETYVATHDDHFDVGFVFNQRWADAGNYHSLRVGLEANAGRDVVVVNCDVVVHPNVYRRVASAPGDLALALQRRDDLDEEDMRVGLADGRIDAISKSLSLERSVGEYAGVSLVAPTAALRYVAHCDELEALGNTSGYYEDVYDFILDSVAATPAEVGPGEYAEVDEPGDVDDALAVIDAWPGLWE